jgi:hypothetical protein
MQACRAAAGATPTVYAATASDVKPDGCYGPGVKETGSGVRVGLSSCGDGVQLDLPVVREKPTDDGYGESFNGRVRDECLNVHSFLSLDNRRARLDAWWVDTTSSACAAHSSVTE